MIDLVFSKESKEIADRMVNAWLVEGLSDQKMQQIIDDNIEPILIN